MIQQAKNVAPKSVLVFHRLLRRAVQAASASGMNEKEIVAMTQRVLREKQGGEKR